MGASERACSLALSVAMTAIATSSVAGLIWLFARQTAFSVAAAVIIVVTAATSYGVTYPISLLPTPHTYGAIGLAVAILTVTLAAGGYLWGAAFLAGAGIAVHPATGLWTAAWMAAAIWIVDRQSARRSLRGFVAGSAVSAISFAVHLATRPAIVPIAPEDTHRYVSSFIQLWDLHRQPVRWTAAGVWFVIAAIGIAAVHWRRSGGGTRLLFSFVVLNGTAAVLFCAVATAVRLPDSILALMPGRFLNMDVVLLPSLIVGLLAPSQGRAWWWSSLVLLALAASDRSPFAPLWPMLTRIPQSLLLAASSVPAALFAARKIDAASRAGRHAAVAVAVTVSLACGVAWFNGPTLHATGARSDLLNNVSDGEVLSAAAARGPGALLVASDLWLIQLRTRRSVVLDPVTVDTLVYAPEGAPFAERVMEDVYGLSLFRVPSASGRQVSRGTNREHWAAFTRADWKRIASTYGATAVLTYRDTVPILTQVVRGVELSLYDLPQ